MPSTWEKPLAISLAFLQPSDFRSNTYRFLITLQPLGGSTSSKTLHLRRESNSLRHACFHSFCASLGIFIMSLKVHSCYVLRIPLPFLLLPTLTLPLIPGIHPHLPLLLFPSSPMLFLPTPLIFFHMLPQNPSA
jgi:hypothetical protein